MLQSMTIATADVMHVDAILDSGATASIFLLNYHNLSKICKNPVWSISVTSSSGCQDDPGTKQPSSPFSMRTCFFFGGLFTLACIACTIWLTAVLDRAPSSCFDVVSLAKDALVFLNFDPFCLVQFSAV